MTSPRTVWPCPMPSITTKVKALYEYASTHEDDLAFGVGQVIIVTMHDDPDWYGGEYVTPDGKLHQGIFPRNFVEKYVRPRLHPPGPREIEQQQNIQRQRAQGVAEAQAAPAPSDAEPSAAAPLAPAVSAMPATKPAEAEAAAPPPSLPPPLPPQSPQPVPSPGMARPVGQAPTSPPARKTSISQQGGNGGKPAPPPVAEKPTSSSFRDRIAAFNNPAAAPIGPFKPGGPAPGSSSANFVKKPFIAPPPSRNAYVPPPAGREVPTAKIYRREEDPEIKEREVEARENAQKAGLLPGGSTDGDEAEDQPKPTSLKERIALLQKQQMEAAQRHAEMAAKKEKPKRPPPAKKRSAGSEQIEGAEVEASGPLDPVDVESTGRRSADEPRQPAQPPRRKQSRSHADSVGDGNEADMSGAGDTTEGLDDVTERDESDGAQAATPPPPPPPPHKARPAPAPVDDEAEVGDQDEGGDEEEEAQGGNDAADEDDDVDLEIRRKEELRARMAKMSGGMGMAGMFGMMPVSAPAPPAKKKKPAAAQSEQGEDDGLAAPARAPPVPTVMSLVLPATAGSRRSDELTRDEAAPRPDPEPAVLEEAEESDELTTPNASKGLSPYMPAIPATRPDPSWAFFIPWPPPPPPPAPPADLASPRSGSDSDDELSEHAQGLSLDTPRSEVPPARIRSPPPPIPQSPASLRSMSRTPPPVANIDEYMPTSPTSPTSAKRSSRPPPPIPIMGRPPPPPPPPPPSGPAAPQMYSPVFGGDGRLGSPIRAVARPGEDEEVTEYEGDYDTDIASSVPHKDALKSRARGSSLDDGNVLSPAPEITTASGTAAGITPRAAPPTAPMSGHEARRSIDQTRRSIDAPRGAPPPPPPPPPPPLPPPLPSMLASLAGPPPEAVAAAAAMYNSPPQPKQQGEDDDYDPYNYTAASAPAPALSLAYPRTPKMEGEDPPLHSPEGAAVLSPTQERRGTLPAGIGSPVVARPPQRQSLDTGRAAPAAGRRSGEMARPSTDFGFIAEEVDLALHTAWWSQPNQVPPAFQGRKDIYVESEKPSATSWETRILFQDYSQTIIAVQLGLHEPAESADAMQRHEPPPRMPRQDQLEQAYERFGRHIAEAVVGKKDTVVGDGTPAALVLELLRPWRDALAPVGTRAYGALVYANLANASTQQNDEIRRGDVMTIRNARFQGKHGPMHAKYSIDVGKPDHVAVVAEWDGTKKKVRVWEQGRESKKVKIESFKLDDLRSGEVKIWRVMPRNWIGWSAVQQQQQ